ncbi:hypothetical protein GHK79_11880 [Enterococcus faecium]|nr:hypothetical protein [Enterococcus faecium]EME3581661.1 hypothetical protein [Enterococcus faecium]EMF0114607.1 hypothetical protein [Enterococcus hirae]MBL3708509.1 hypothetical protein [Enterococcus faecium]
MKEKKKGWRMWLIFLYFWVNFEIGGTLVMMIPSIVRNLDWAMMTIHIVVIVLWLCLCVCYPICRYKKNREKGE